MNYFADGVRSDSDEPMMNGIPVIKKVCTVAYTCVQVIAAVHNAKPLVKNLAVKIDEVMQTSSLNVDCKMLIVKCCL